MEKRKLLLVAISVGLFLVITIGAALVIFVPRNVSAPQGAIVSRPAPGGTTNITVPPPAHVPPPSVVEPQRPGTAVQVPPVDPVELVRRPEEVPGLTPLPEGVVQRGGNFYVSGTAETVVIVPRPAPVVVPEPAPRGAPAPPRPAPAVTARPAPPAPAPAPAAAPRPAPAAPRPAAPPARPPVQTRVHNDYWIQTGAFSTIDKAENVKQDLANRGITSIIENRTVDGRNLFRVRVGPYTTHNEANYWLALIRSMNGFEDSQVRMTPSRR